MNRPNAPPKLLPMHAPTGRTVLRRAAVVWFLAGAVTTLLVLAALGVIP